MVQRLLVVRKNNIKTNWDYTDLAQHYDLRADYSKLLIKKILRKIKCQKNYPVADVGAGTAKLTKLLCENNLIVNAIEPNKCMRFYDEKNTKILQMLIGQPEQVKNLH